MTSNKVTLSAVIITSLLFVMNAMAADRTDSTNLKSTLGDPVSSPQIPLIKKPVATRIPTTMAPTSDYPNTPSSPPDTQDTEGDIETGEPHTQTVLPLATGSLMNRELSPPPKELLFSSQQKLDESEVEPNELVVISNNMGEARLLTKQLGGYGLRAKQRRKLKHLGLVISTFTAPAEIDLPQTAINIHIAYPQMWADLNHRYKLLGSNRNTLAAQNIIKWTRKNPSCGKGLRIGLIDTQINTSHPALQNQKVITHSVVTNGLKMADADHGTAIAALLVGNPKSESFSGLLPSAELYAVSVFRQRDTTNIDTTSEWIVSAIDWLVSQDVQIINMSIGGPRNLLVDAVIQRITQSGIPVVAAVGNGGADANAVFPAAQPGVIAVTAVDSELALYKNANQGNYIDFAAPGVDIWAADAKGSGKFFSGTSFAAPFVTAHIISILKKYGTEKYYTQLQQTARDLGDKGKDQKFGWGLIQAPEVCNCC